MNANNILIKKIYKITIKKEEQDKECHIEFASDSAMKCSILNESIEYRCRYDIIVGSRLLKWQDMFSDGVQVLVEALFENLDTGEEFTGIYDILGNSNKFEVIK